MSNNIQNVTQMVLPFYPRLLPVRQFHRRHMGEATRLLKDSEEFQHIGVAVTQSEHGVLQHLVLSTSEHIVAISLEGNPRELHTADQSFRSLLREDQDVVMVGFDMARLAIHIHRRLGFQVRAVDLSTLCSGSTNSPWSPSKMVARKLYSGVDIFAVDGLWHADDLRDACLRAWISSCVAKACGPDITASRKVDTTSVNKTVLECLGSLVVESDILQSAKPKESYSEFTKSQWTDEGHLRVVNDRYKTRLRQSKQTRVVMTNEDGREFFGRPGKAQGRATTIKFDGARVSGTIESVRVVGRQELTNAERASNEFLLLALQGRCNPLDSQFVRTLWFPTLDDIHSAGISENHLLVGFPDLNQSQRKVTAAMVSRSIPMVIVHGPPGTGKTTTIAAAAQYWNQRTPPDTAWIVAQSNVAVKNIAEKLFSRGIDFKLLVSKEFHFEWHEHIYTEIETKVLRVDELPPDIRALERVIGSSSIILSTLSTLSNPGLDEKGMFRLAPVERLVIDEASQIKIFDYMHLFHKFRGELQKVCFFGDPKQLPPYGQEKVPSLKSIFQVDHLRFGTYLLNVQYRMPLYIGRFISSQVYDNKLCSSHKIDGMSCVTFIDASKGVEMKSRNGVSWINEQEIDVIVHLVRSYYAHREFCIITPYDAQRAAIEKQLKAWNLPWEKVFTVDSFQGNEEKYVLISIVRTSKIGFLQSINRMNVMLTRCKAGMTIVTNRAFLRNAGRPTLVGKLAESWEKQYSSTWTDWTAVMNGRVSLPGAPGRNASSSVSPHTMGQNRWTPGTPLQQTSSARVFDVKSLFRPLVVAAYTGDTTSHGNTSRSKPIKQMIVIDNDPFPALPVYDPLPTKPAKMTVGDWVTVAKAKTAPISSPGTRPAPARHNAPSVSMIWSQQKREHLVRTPAATTKAPIPTTPHKDPRRNVVTTSSTLSATSLRAFSWSPGPLQSIKPPSLNVGYSPTPKVPKPSAWSNRFEVLAAKRPRI